LYQYVSGHYPSSCLYLETQFCLFFRTQRFCLRLQVKPNQLAQSTEIIPAQAASSLADFSTRSSETSVNTRSTRRHIPDDGILHSHGCENLKSYKEDEIVSDCSTKGREHECV
jgi:hypothetical protein